MTFPFHRHFEAHLPLVATAVRITSLSDAQVFMRRWVIRDKDRNLKALLRTLERANSAARINVAMEDFKRALAAHGLLPKHTWSSCVRHEAPAEQSKEQIGKPAIPRADTVPADGYVLSVDGKLKAKFEASEEALAAGTKTQASLSDSSSPSI